MDDQKKMTENGKKKEYLKQYQTCRRKIKRIEAELSEIREMRCSISINTDGMPHARGQGDLSGYAARLDEQERDLRVERYNRIKLYMQISEQIKLLEDDNESDVLFYHYIKGKDWWEVAEIMNYSERHVLRLHGRALSHFQITKDVIECQ